MMLFDLLYQSNRFKLLKTQQIEAGVWHTKVTQYCGWLFLINDIGRYSTKECVINSVAQSLGPDINYASRWPKSMHQYYLVPKARVVDTL